MKTIYLLFACMFTANIFAQKVFMKTIGSANEDGIYRAIATPDSGILAIGYEDGMDNTSQFFGKKIFWNRFDKNGQLLASKAIGFAVNEKGYNIMSTSDGGYLISSEGKYCVNANCGTDGFLIKTDAQGNKLWAKGIGGLLWDDIYASVEIPGGDYVIIGNTASYGNGNFDAFLMRIQANGDTVWSSTYGSDAPVQSAQETARDIIYHAGALYGAGMIYRGADAKFFPWIFKTDLSGNLIWSKLLSTNASVGSVFGLQAIGNHLYFFSGNRAVKFDTAGNLLKMKALPTGFSGQYGNPYYGNMKATSDGQLLICGQIQSKACLLKLDTALTLQWGRIYPEATASATFATSVDELQDGRILLGGMVFNSGINTSRIWVTHADGGLSTCADSIAFTFGIDTGSFIPAATIAMRTGFMINGNATATTWTVPSSEFIVQTQCEANYTALPPPLSVAQDVAQSDFLLYPNPASDFIILKGIDNQFNVMGVYALDGKVYQLPGTFEAKGLKLDTHSLPSGIYLLSVGNETGIHALRFVKQ